MNVINILIHTTLQQKIESRKNSFLLLVYHTIEPNTIGSIDYIHESVKALFPDPIANRIEWNGFIVIILCTMRLRAQPQVPFSKSQWSKITQNKFTKKKHI